MITARQISKAYHGKRVLNDISLSFEAGKITALLGGNGAGKSTLLRILSGATAPSSGEVIVDGLSSPRRSIREARAAGVWLADQEGSLIPAWSVEEHFRRFAGTNSAQPWRVAVPAVQGREKISDLPQNERQLIEVVLVCTGGVKAALVDEPTAGQGSSEKRIILDTLKRAAAMGSTVVLATHDFDAALAVADRYIVLKAGNIVTDVTPGRATKADLLAWCNVPAPPATPPLALPQAESRNTRMQIRFENGTNETIHINAGEILGIVSTSTCRARDVLRSAAGLGPQTQFQIEFTNPSDRAGLAYMSRERDIEWDFSGKSLRFNLTAGVINQLSKFGVVNERHDMETAEALRHKFSIEAASLNSLIDELSGGNRQKALLARLTARRPGILLLDEPFSGVDAQTREKLRAELRFLAGEGAAVAIYSQEWDDLLQAVDQVVVVRNDYRLVSLDAHSTSSGSIEAILA
jgi:ABC-type sugar transport system ATPase subunit